MITSVNAVRPVPVPSSPPPPAAVAPAAVNPARVLDTSKIGFRVTVEVVDVDPNKLNRSISKHGWNAALTSDCSHGYNDSHKAYVILNSPLMHAGDAAWKTIHEVLGEAVTAGAKLGNSGAMRVLVENKTLDLETYKSLMRLQMACEPIIYKAARNGKAAHCGEIGWNSPAAPKRQQGGYYFCTPPSANAVNANALHATTVQQLQQTLAGGGSYVARHYGFQPFSVTQSGFSEFRYFTGTTDADIVCADVQMVLGMVKCAHEGRWPASIPPHAVTDPKPVDYKTHALFKREVLGEAAERIDSLFKAAGGTISAPPLDIPELRDHKLRLEQAGWRFDPPNLADITAETPINVLEPGQAKPYALNHEELPLLLRVENGAAPAPHAAVLDHLRTLGVTFFAADAKVATNARCAPALLLGQGRLEAAYEGTRLPILNAEALAQYATDTQLASMMKAGWSFEHEGPLSLGALTDRLRKNEGVDVRPPQSPSPVSLRAEQVTALARAEGGLLDLLAPEQRAALDQTRQIAQRGITFETPDGQPLDAATAWVLSADSGRVQARQGDETLPFEAATRELLTRTTSSLPTAFAAALQGLPAADAHLVDPQGAPTSWDARIAWLHRKGELFAQRGADRVAVDSAAAVRDKVMRPHLEASLDAAQQARLAKIQRLEAAGYALHSGASTRLQPSSLEWLQAVASDAGPWHLQAPDSKQLYPMTASGIDNLRRHLDGEAIDADLQDALQKADALRAAGCVLPSAIDTLMGLSASREVRWIDPLGHAHHAAGTEAFRASTGAQLDAIHMTDGQRAALVGLINASTTVLTTAKAGVTPNQVPWLIAGQSGLEVRARVEDNVPADARPAAVSLRGWDAIERFAEVERDASKAGATGALLAHMRAIGAQVYPVTATRRARKAAVPMTLNSAALASLDQNGLRFQLPSWTFWKGWPRRNVVVHGAAELERLAHKFKAPAVGAH